MSRYRWRNPFPVMAGVVPAIHVLPKHAKKTWMAVTSTAMTPEGWT